MNEPYYTVAEAAKRLKRHPNTIRTWCETKVFPNARKIGHSWYIPKTDVDPEPPKREREGRQS